MTKEARIYNEDKIISLIMIMVLVKLDSCMQKKDDHYLTLYTKQKETNKQTIPQNGLKT